MPVTLVQQRNLTYYNVKDFGATGNGATDDTAAIAAAIAAAAVNGGTVFFPQGTYLSTTQTLVANVSLVGAGLGATTIRLKNATNADLFSAQTASINLAAAANSGIAGTLNKFCIENMTLDGNKANQSSGPSYPIRFYGYNFTIRNIEVLNGFTGGTLIDWNGGSSLASPSDQMESLIDNSKFHDNNGIGLQFGGPHDSRWTNVLSWSNGSHNFHLCPNSAGVLATNCHGYLVPNTAGVCCWLIEATSGVQCTNCMAEGSYVCNVAMLSPSCSWISGQIFGQAPDWTSVIGLQLGQTAGNTPFLNQIKQAAGVTTAVAANGCNIDTAFNECRGGSFSFQNEQNNVIIANVYQTVGTVSVGGVVPAVSDTFIVNVTGLTADGTFGKSGGTQFVSGATNALTVRNNSGGTPFQISGTVPAHLALNTGVNVGIAFLVGTGGDTNQGLVIFANSVTQSVPLLALQNSAFSPVFTVDKAGGTQISGHVGIGTGPNAAISHLITPDADATRGLAVYAHSATQSASLLALQTSAFVDVLTVDKNGTLTIAGQLATGQSATAAVIATAGTITTTAVGVARVAPTANVTGVILQAGTVAGQICTVINESAFALTFAVSGTGHVADGVANTILPLSSRDYTWDSITALWYAMSTAPAQSAAAVVIAASGTIATAGLDVTIVAPTAARAAIILQAGTYAGQRVMVINSATTTTFSVTFDVSGTSNVAQGVSAVINGLAQRIFVWNSLTNLWY